MKIKRQKKVQRILNFFKNNFGHHPPYQILIDGTFCQACLTMKVNIKDQLPKYLGEVKLLTTKCCIQEVEKLGPSLYGAMVILKQFSVHQCGHDEAAVPAVKCIKSMLGTTNSDRYFVASQDSEVRERARKVSGTPLIYLYRSAPTLEKPSERSSASAATAATDRMAGSSFQSMMIKHLKRKEFGDPEARRKRKKKGGANPLSCKKKKKTLHKSDGPSAKLETAGKKRKRNRNKKQGVAAVPMTPTSLTK